MDINRPRLAQETLFVVDHLQQPDCVLTRGNQSAAAAIAVPAVALLVLLWWIDPREVAVPLCALHYATGLHCPGCGATRATHDLLHGRLASALRHNGLWIFALPAVLYAVAGEIRRTLWGRTLPGELIRNPRFFTLMVILALIFGVLRNVPCWPLDLLAPPG